MLGRDDYASIAAVALGVAQYATVFMGMPLGLGTSKAGVREGNGPETGRVGARPGVCLGVFLLIAHAVDISRIGSPVHLRLVHGKTCRALSHGATPGRKHDDGSQNVHHDSRRRWAGCIGFASHDQFELLHG